MQKLGNCGLGGGGGGGFKYVGVQGRALKLQPVGAICLSHHPAAH